jgi:hypothetical protein
METLATLISNILEDSEALYEDAAGSLSAHFLLGVRSALTFLKRSLTLKSEINRETLLELAETDLKALKGAERGKRMSADFSQHLGQAFAFTLASRLVVKAPAKATK